MSFRTQVDGALAGKAPHASAQFTRLNLPPPKQRATQPYANVGKSSFTGRTEEFEIPIRMEMILSLRKGDGLSWKALGEPHGRRTGHMHQ